MMMLGTVEKRLGLLTCYMPYFPLSRAIDRAKLLSCCRPCGFGLVCLPGYQTPDIFYCQSTYISGVGEACSESK